MRVAVITRDFPPMIGGIATHVDELVKALQNIGISVDVFVGGSDYKTLLMPFGISLGKYDLVHVQSTPYGAFVLGVPLIITAHSPVLTEFDHYSRLVKLQAVPAIGLEKFSISRARMVLAVTELTRQDLIEGYHVRPEKVSVIGNGVDFQKFASARRDYSSNEILMASRLEPRKNVEEAIRAMSKLPRGSYHAKIAGDGSQRVFLEKVARRLGVDLDFLGRVEGSSLPPLYGGAGIFLTTSYSEGFGLTVLEAMAAGCVVVASDIPAHRALIEHDVNGALYGNESELVSLLRELLSSRDRRMILAERARNVARQYSGEKVAKRVAESYDRALSPE
jgi:glycosyltransferase involved in cell wall biosynthesis